MSDSEIVEFVTAAGLPSVYAAQVELRTYLRPVLRVRPHDEWPGPGWEVTFPFPLPGSPAFEKAVDALPRATHAWDASQALQGTFDWDDEARAWHFRYEDTGAFHLEILEVAVGGGALWFLEKLGEAFVARIADRFAESAAKAAERIRLRRSPASDCVTIKVSGGTTFIVLPEPITDEAREAFIDLDPDADGFSGKILYWDQDARAWAPGDHLPPDQEEQQPGDPGPAT